MTTGLLSLEVARSCVLVTTGSSVNNLLRALGHYYLFSGFCGDMFSLEVAGSFVPVLFLCLSVTTGSSVKSGGC